MWAEKQRCIDLYIIDDNGKDRVKNYDETVKNYIRYYHSRSRFCKFNYYFLNVVKVVSLTLIPVLQVIDLLEEFPWLTVALSGLGLLIDSLINLFHLKEKWQLYRKTCSVVSAEQRKFSSRCEPYCGDDAFCQYVKNIERIISDESKKWSDTVSEKEVKKEKVKKGKKECI